MLAIEWEQGLNDAWTRIATFVPKLLGFFAILIIGYFVAKILARAADAILERIGFDGWVERGSLKAALERSKFDPSDIVAVIVFWTIFLISMQLAFGIFGPNPISDLITGIIAYLPNVIVAVVILVIAAAVAKVVTDLLSAMLGSVQGGTWMARGAGMAILVVGVFAALNQLQIAPEIVNGLYYAILIAIVGLHDRGGRRRWDPHHAALLGAHHDEARERRRRYQGATPTPMPRGRPRSSGCRRSAPRLAAAQARTRSISARRPCP